MELELIKKKKKEIIEQFGEWTAHNIQLREDIYTIDNRLVGQELKLRCIVQILSDICCEPISNLRILDLACLEGLYAIELARQGAQVVAIEGREANFIKTQFAKDVLALDNLELIQDDVRNLNVDKFGHFDVVLCTGILYHLDTPDVFDFLQKIAEVCRRVTVIDTHTSMTPKESRSYKGNTYWGNVFTEFSEEATQEEKEKSLWASLDNVKSFWLTRHSLFNLLQNSGFSSVYECKIPVLLGEFSDRFMFMALKGQRPNILSAPLSKDIAFQNYPSPEIQQASEIQQTISEGKEQEVNILLTAKLEKIKSQLQSTQVELEHALQRVSLTQSQVQQEQGRIAAMESSKFWKLRTAWFRLKKLIGITVDK